MKIVQIENSKQLIFYCEGCKENHYIDDKWDFNGDFEKPTIAPSVLVRGVERITDEEFDLLAFGAHIEPRPFVCHSFVTDGKVQYLNDCTHHLAGQTVELKDEEYWYK